MSTLDKQGLEALKAKVQSNAARYCAAIDQVIELIVSASETLDQVAEPVRAPQPPAAKTRRQSKRSAPTPKSGRAPSLRDLVTQIVSGWSGAWSAKRVREVITKEHPSYVDRLSNLQSSLMLMVDRGELIRTGKGWEATYEKTTKLGQGPSFGRMSKREQEYRALRDGMGISGAKEGA